MNIEQRDETLHMMHEHAACAHRRRWAKRYASRKGFAAVDKLSRFDAMRCDAMRSLAAVSQGCGGLV